MLLTAEQLQEIRDIIAKRHNVFAVTAYGPDAVSKEVLAALAAQGLVDVEIASLTDAYIYGKVAAALGDDRARSMTYAQFKSYVKSNPQPLNAAETHAVQVAASQGGALCQGLGNTIDKNTGQLLIEADAELRNQVKDVIATKTAQNIARRQTIGNLKSELGHATGDWTRNLNRIAVTETQTAMQNGLAEALRDKHGPEARVAKLTSPKACPACIRAYKGPDGAPRIFKLAALQATGTNQGRTQAEYRATVGPLHPLCHPPYTRVSTAWGRRDIQYIKPGDLVWTHKNRLRPVTHVWCQQYDGDMVTVECGWRAVRATPQHPMFDGQVFKAAKDFVAGDTLADDSYRKIPLQPPKEPARDFKNFATIAFGDGPLQSFLALITDEGVFVYDGLIYRRGFVQHGAVVPGLTGRLRFRRGAAASICGGDTLVLQGGTWVGGDGQSIVLRRIVGNIAQSLRLRCATGPFACFDKDWKQPIAADPEALSDRAQGKAAIEMQMKKQVWVNGRRSGLGAAEPWARGLRQGAAYKRATASQKTGDGCDRHSFVVEEGSDRVRMQLDAVFSQGRYAKTAQQTRQLARAGAKVGSYKIQGLFVVEMTFLDGVYIDIGIQNTQAPDYVSHDNRMPLLTEVSKVKQRPYRGPVYNLTVLDDATFYAEGFLSHNCQCQLVHLPNGAAFDAKGRMKMGGEYGILSDPNTLEDTVAHKSMLKKAMALGADEVTAFDLPLGVTRWARPKEQAQWLLDSVIIHSALDIRALVGPNSSSEEVYVIHGKNGPDSVSLGYSRPLDAALAYQSRYPQSGIESIDAISLAAFRDYLSAQEKAVRYDDRLGRADECLVLSTTQDNVQKSDSDGVRLRAQDVDRYVDQAVRYNTAQKPDKRLVLNLQSLPKPPKKRQDIGGVQDMLRNPNPKDSERTPVKFDIKASQLYADQPAIAVRDIDKAAGEMDEKTRKDLIKRNARNLKSRMADQAAQVDFAHMSAKGARAILHEPSTKTPKREPIL